MLNALHKALLVVVALLGFMINGGVEMAVAQTTAENSTSLTETYGDWVVRCESLVAMEGLAAPTQACEMTQELRLPATGSRVLAVTVWKAETGARLTIAAPFGLLLSEGIKVEVADTLFLSANFLTCLPRGCMVVTDLEPATVTILAAGDQAGVGMIDINGHPKKVNISLRGFTAAWKRLNAL